MGGIVFKMFNVLDTLDPGTVVLANFGPVWTIDILLNDNDVETSDLDLLVCCTEGGGDAVDLLIALGSIKLLLVAAAASDTGVITTADLDFLGGLTVGGDKSDILVVMGGDIYPATDADRLTGLRRSSG